MRYEHGQLIAILPCDEIPEGKILKVDLCTRERVFFTDGTYASLKDLGDGTWGIIQTITEKK